MSQRFVTSGGIDLAVFEEGNPAGPVLLLVHGYPDTHEVWDDICAGLAADYRLVRYDVRGAGRSGRPVNLAGYQLDQLADDLFAVIEAVGGQAHVAAHDWGSIQAWHAVTDPRAAGRIASFTSISGPCLDHVGFWLRRRLLHPTPRHVAQLGRQLAKSWYIGVFQLPLLAPAAWRWGLARRWPGVLQRAEGVVPRPGFPADTLCGDAIRGISLYRVNMGPRRPGPRQPGSRRPGSRRPGSRRPGPRPRRTGVPVQLITLTRDHYVSPALFDGLECWAPNLTRRTLAATHWSALTVQASAVAGMIREFAAP
jgi:pimeloyl-ACP methyl ester carboxylesterase